MTISSTIDPVQTMVDILEYSLDPDAYGDRYGLNYSSSELWEHAGPPDLVERYEETEFSRKKRRDMKDAVYVIKADGGSFDQLGAGMDPYIDDSTVRIEVWTPTSSTKAHEYARDVREIAKRFTNDNQTFTAWTRIAPIGDEDNRAATRARGVDQYVMAVLVQLLATRK